MMRYVFVVGALAGCLWLGSWLVQWVGLPVPGALAGMVLLLAGLLCLPRVPNALARVSDWMLRHLVLWILPSALGVVAYVATLQQHWLPIVLAGVIGTALTTAVTAWVFVAMLRWTGHSTPPQAPTPSGSTASAQAASTTTQEAHHDKH